MAKRISKEPIQEKRGRGRQEKPEGEPRVETTVAMGVTYAERAQLKLEAISRRPAVSMSNLLRDKMGLSPIT
jgi:hypothetical protein